MVRFDMDYAISMSENERVETPETESEVTQILELPNARPEVTILELSAQLEKHVQKLEKMLKPLQQLIRNSTRHAEQIKQIHSQIKQVQKQLTRVEKNTERVIQKQNKFHTRKK